MITDKTNSMVVCYPQYEEYTTLQLEKFFWRASEVKVEKDLQDLRVNLTPAELHGVLTVLKLFVRYEQFVGNELWATTIMKKFPRPEIEAMCATFSMIELAVHAKFYDKVNQVLGIANDEFYNSYTKDPVLKSRMTELGAYVLLAEKGGDLAFLQALAVFSMIEGCLLYSSFAFLKHFQTNGKNKLKNIVSGINQSAIDENLHCVAGSDLYRTYKKELNLSDEYEQKLKEAAVDAAKKLVDHEYRIIDMIFEKGHVDGIDAEGLKTFVNSRANICLNNLGYDSVFDEEDNYIAKSFYAGIDGYISNDFFAGLGREYTTGWSQSEFESVW